jgi:hypothetical protein
VSLSKESKFFLTMLELLRLFCVKMTVSFLGAISQMVWLECEMSTTGSHVEHYSCPQVVVLS